MKEKPQKIEPGQIWELKIDIGISAYFKITSLRLDGNDPEWNHVCIKEGQYWSLGDKGWEYQHNYLDHEGYTFIGYAEEEVETISEEKLCSCNIQQLMTTGCRCGGK
jgi:hypothetical protein